MTVRGSQRFHLQSNELNEPLTIHGIHAHNLYDLRIHAIHVKGSTKNLPAYKLTLVIRLFLQCFHI